MQTKKKAAIHERKILTDQQLFSLKLLCLRCGQNFIIDQLIGLIGGMESGFAVYAKSEEEFQDEIIKTLAGKAGTALIYGIMDIRAVADIKKADQLLDIWLCHFAGGGFSGVEPSENRLSEPRLSYNEAIKSAKLEELYRRAYKILYDNRDFLLAVQKELLEHETLLNSDLAKIRESCT